MGKERKRMENNIKRSKNFLKNIKITTLLVIILILTALSTSYLSYSSLGNMETLSNDMNDLYEKNMLTSLDLKHLETEFYIIRLNMSNMMYSNQYDGVAAENIETQKDSLVQVFNKYRDFDLTGEEREIFDNIEATYNSYIGEADQIIADLKSGKQIDKNGIHQLGNMANEVQWKLINWYN